MLGPAGLAARIALVAFTVAWCLHAANTMWRADVAADVAEVVADTRRDELAATIADVAADAGVTVDPAAVAAAAGTSQLISDAAVAVWRDRLGTSVDQLGDTLDWAVDVGTGGDTTVTIDPGAITDVLAEIDPAAAAAWDAQAAGAAPVTVDVDVVARLGDIGRLPAAAGDWVWPAVLIGLIAAGVAVLAGGSQRPKIVARFAGWSVAVGAGTLILLRFTEWAAQRDDTAGVVAAAIRAIAAPLGAQSILLVVAGAVIAGAAAFLRLLSRPA
jgi:hypothetical protein